MYNRLAQCLYGRVVPISLIVWNFNFIYYSLYFYYLLIYFSIRSTDLFFVSECILHRLLASFKLTAAPKNEYKRFFWVCSWYK